MNESLRNIFNNIPITSNSAGISKIVNYCKDAVRFIDGDNVFCRTWDNLPNMQQSKKSKYYTPFGSSPLRFTNKANTLISAYDSGMLIDNVIKVNLPYVQVSDEYNNSTLFPNHEMNIVHLIPMIITPEIQGDKKKLTDDDIAICDYKNVRSESEAVSLFIYNMESLEDISILNKYSYINNLFIVGCNNIDVRRHVPITSNISYLYIDHPDITPLAAKRLFRNAKVLANIEHFGQKYKQSHYNKLTSSIPKEIPTWTIDNGIAYDENKESIGRVTKDMTGIYRYNARKYNIVGNDILNKAGKIVAKLVKTS